jgi:hypothetical protein
MAAGQRPIASTAGPQADAKRTIEVVLMAAAIGAILG